MRSIDTAYNVYCAHRREWNGMGAWCCWLNFIPFNFRVTRKSLAKTRSCVQQAALVSSSSTSFQFSVSFSSARILYLCSLWITSSLRVLNNTNSQHYSPVFTITLTAAKHCCRALSRSYHISMLYLNSSSHCCVFTFMSFRLKSLSIQSECSAS